MPTRPRRTATPVRAKSSSSTTSRKNTAYPSRMRPATRVSPSASPAPAVVLPGLLNVAKVGVEATLSERGKTHGSFEENGRLMQELKGTMRAFNGWHRLTPYQREALEMICHKIGRIICGDPNYPDHWHDIAGYAKLVEDLIAKYQQ